MEDSVCREVACVELSVKETYMECDSKQGARI